MARAALLPEGGQCQGGSLVWVGLSTPRTSPRERASPTAIAMPYIPGGSVRREQLAYLKGCGQTLRKPTALRKLCGRTYVQESSVLLGLLHREPSRPLGSALGFLMTLGKTLQSSPFLKCLAQLICPDWDRHISDNAKHKGPRYCLNLLDATVEQIVTVSRQIHGLYASGHDRDASGKILTEIPASKLVLFLRGSSLQLLLCAVCLYNHFSHHVVLAFFPCYSADKAQ